MASGDQPLKKRKLYEPLPEAPNANQQGLVSPPPPPPSPEELLRKRRNKDEIRKLYDCYKRIRFCISHKDARLMSDFEQAYLSLITASRGCTSVQRIVAELIPRYASFCPTALEAAAKVAINMYNWSVAIVMRDEDADAVAYETAKTCIFGLIDICCTASSEAPTSSVIRGICSAVFINVLSFFTSTFEGKDIYQIDSKDVDMLQEPVYSFIQLKHENEEDEEPALLKLFRFRVIGFLKILFSCPKNLLEACFELVSSSNPDVGGEGKNKGHYLLHQVTSQINFGKENDLSGKNSSEMSSLRDPVQSSEEVKEINEKHDSVTHIIYWKSSFQKACLLEMVIDKEPSLKEWLLLRYKRFCQSVNPEVAAEVSHLLERVFGSLPEVIQDPEKGEDSDEDALDSSKYVNQKYLLHKVATGHDRPADRSGGDHSLKSGDALTGNAFSAKGGEAGLSGQSLRSHLPVLPSEADSDIGRVFDDISEGSSVRRKLETVGNRESSLDKASLPKDSMSISFDASAAIRSWDKTDLLGKETLLGMKDIPSMEVKPPSTRSISANCLMSSEQHSVGDLYVRPSTPSSQIVWYSDGDHSAMSVFSASRQLWLGSLGHDASETVVRLQFEDFGPIERFLFFRLQDFALIEYRNIMDAVRARELMGGSSPWGACLNVKFVDAGLGSRGAIHDVAIGDSCHVYVGKVPNLCAKDEILQELTASGLKSPRMVTDLTSECALLMEFESAEHAVLSMACIRKMRKEAEHHGMADRSLKLNPPTKDNNSSSCQLLVRHIDTNVTDRGLINAFSCFGELIGWKFVRQSSCCLIDFYSCEAAALAKSHLNGVRFGNMHISVETRAGNLGSMGRVPVSSTTSSSVYTDFISSCNMSQLFGLFSSLCIKCGITQSRYFHSSTARDENQVPSNALCISLPDAVSPVADDDIMALCNLAAGGAGTVVRLTRSSAHNVSWFVELSSVDAALAALRNIQACPGSFLHVEFRNPGVAFYHEEWTHVRGTRNVSAHFPSHDGFSMTSMEPKHQVTPFNNKPDFKMNEGISSRMKLESVGLQGQKGLAFVPNWPVTGVGDLMEPPSRDDTKSVKEPFLTEGPAISQSVEEGWNYKKHDNEHRILAPESTSCPPPLMHGGAINAQRPPLPPPPPPLPVQASSFMRPVLFTPNGSWDTRGLNPSLPPNQMPTTVLSNNNLHSSTCITVPFIPPSVTPLAQLSGGSVQPLDQMVAPPSLPSSLPPPPSVPPPIPPSPPPLPLSQPPLVPPPPSSPPPHSQISIETSHLQTVEPSADHQWQGMLCKSGVHYCTITAKREISDICKYSNAIAEPAEWPPKLDVTKRTDFRHVKATFSATPPCRREVCRLLPTTAGDMKGFRDFISYLKQRECAGVIKIPARASLWARLLFILPNSADACSLLSIPPHPSECLIALVLPKETNFECV